MPKWSWSNNHTNGDIRLMSVTTITSAGITDATIATADIADNAVTTAKAAFNAGKILQIQTLASDSTVNTSSSSFVDAITLTGVTPVAQNSKFLIELTGGYTSMPNDKYMATRFQVRENSGSYATLTTGSQYAATLHGCNASYLTSPHSFSYLYTVTDTSSLTALAVNIQFASVNTAGTVNWNNASMDSGNGDGYVLLKVIEIGA